VVSTRKFGEAMSRTVKDVRAKTKYKRTNHGTPLRGCNCLSCKLGRKQAHGRAAIVKAVSGDRALTRVVLAKGEFEKIPAKIYIGYTW
jgi:hypothetical protein